MSDRAAMQQAQLDVITVTLMREGINKHRARELADHFVNFTLTPALPVQEPVGYVKGTYAGRLIYDTINPAVCLPVGMALYTAPLPVQEPVMCRFCHSKKGCWAWQCYKCGEIDDVQKPAPPQRQWVGLTEEEIEVIGDKVANEDLVGLVSNFRGRLAKAIEQTLKERNT